MTELPPHPTFLDAAELDGLRPHPLSDLFPAMGGDKFDRLSADASHRGIVDPATLCDGMILDGRARVGIARQLRIPCPVIYYTGPDPLGYALAQNCLGNHYSIGQRTMIAAKIANLRQGERSGLTPATWPVSQEAAAKALGVGERSVRRGRYILDHGTPEEIEAAVAGRQDPGPLAAAIKRRVDGGHDPSSRIISIRPLPRSNPSSPLSAPCAACTSMSSMSCSG
jgi:hypothetical protein